MGGDLAMSQNIVISHSATIPASLPRKAGLQVKLSAGCRCLAVSDRLLESSARAGWSSGHTFGNGGIFRASPQLRSYFRRSSEHGKIVIGGQVNGEGAVLRVTSNGKLDTGFGSAA